MDEHSGTSERFEEHRGHLRAVAYRMLGSLDEADDAVQEAWLRLRRAGEEGVENLGGWLTTVVARVCLDRLRSRKAQREEPLGFDVPDPVVAREDGGDPEHQALLVDAVGLALLVVLERLAPAERLAFVLHDLFAVPFEEIAPIVERTPAAARQLASRARRRVQGISARHLVAVAGTFDPPVPTHTFGARRRQARSRELAEPRPAPRDRSGAHRGAAEDRQRQRQPVAGAGVGVG